MTNPNGAFLRPFEADRWRQRLFRFRFPTAPRAAARRRGPFDRREFSAVPTPIIVTKYACSAFFKIYKMSYDLLVDTFP